jgi:hypothetical protein
VYPSRRPTLIYTGLQASNIYITPAKKVLVGRDLFTTARHGDEFEDHVTEIPGDLSEWLKGEFWDITKMVRSPIAEFVFKSQAVFYSFFMVTKQQLIGHSGSVR